jgi:hypothetical protein
MKDTLRKFNDYGRKAKFMIKELSQQEEMI